MIKILKNLMVFFVLTIGVIFLFYNNPELNFKSLVFLNILYTIILSLILFYYYFGRAFVHIPIFFLTNIYFLFCYVGIFFLDIDIILNWRIPKIYDSADYELAIEILFYGYIIFVIGYFLSIYILRNFHRSGYEFFDLKNSEIFTMGMFFIIPSIILFYLIKIQSLLPALAQLKYPLILTGIGLLTLYLSINIKKILSLKNIICMSLISIPLFLEIITGSFSFPFLVIFLIFVYLSYINKKVFLLPVIIIGLSFLFIHLGKYEYRNIVWKKSYSGLDINKIFIFIDTYKNIITRGPENFKKVYECKFTANNTDEYCAYFTDYQLERRIFHSIESLLFVTKYTKSNENYDDVIHHDFKYVPYWEGYSYKILITKIVPRIFWKDKPSDRLGNEFGHRYNLLLKNDLIKKTILDEHTSWNMPVLNEFYSNFGKKGVLIGMFLLGVLFGILSKIGSITNYKNIESVILFFLFVPLFFIESHLSLLFGAVLQSYIFLIVLSYFILKILRKYLVSE